ncbi:MAG: hypothetical protein ACI9YH_003842 [Colwellia sp.]|jgi:hypothetical protein
MKLKEWVASYAGCDGGSPDKSSIWFVGIEWGFAKDKGQNDKEHDKSVADYHQGSMLESIKNGYAQPDADTFIMGENIDYPFGRNAGKLIAAVKGHTVDNYKIVAENTSDTDIFKLNLYPVALPKDHDNLWIKFNLESLTGLKNKQDYRDYCKEHRFPFFRQEFRNHAPQLILCTGTSYVEQFSKCFVGIDEISDLHSEKITDVSTNNNKPRTLFWKWVSQDTLFVAVPFMTNAAGLNSHSLLQQFGDRIKKIMDEGNIH